MPHRFEQRSFVGRLLLLLVLVLSGLNAQAESAPRVGLALGSGGAAGLAHIAMLKVFDQHGQRPQHIAGASIGAVIGMLYAAGLSGEEIEALFAEFGGSGLDLLSSLARGENGFSLSDLIDLDLGDGGLIDPQGFLDFLAGHIEARRFEDLEIGLSVVATSYFDGQTVVIESGDLFEAVRASMSVPGLFAPVEREKQLLIDGGMSNPLPWDLLEGKADFSVAVDVTGQREPPQEGSVPINELVFKSFELMQQSIIKARLENVEPDLYLQPDVSGVRLLHFHRVGEIIDKAQPEADRLAKFLADLPGRPDQSSSSSSQP